MSNGSRFEPQSSAWRRAPTPTGSIADQIMDRIDSQIRGISTDPPARFAAPLPKTSLDGLFLSSLPTSTSNLANTTTRHAAHPPSTHANDDAASTSTMRLLQNFNPADMKLTDLESDLGTDLGEAMPTAAPKLNIPTSDRSRNTIPEPDVDVSSVVAMQINEQYREVLSHKQTAMDYPYQSDNDTVRTEDFANKYRELQKAVAKMPDNGNPTMSDSAREVVDRANSIIDRYKHAAHAESASATALKAQAGDSLTAAGAMRNYSAAQNHHQLGSQAALRLNVNNKFDRMNLSGNAQRSFKLLSPLTSGSQTPVDSQPTAVTLRKAENSRGQVMGSATTSSVHFATPFSRSDIKKESELIKSEMELERRKKQLQEMVTRKDFSNIVPAKQPAVATFSPLPIQKESDVARERLYAKLTELEGLNTEIKHLRTDRDRVVEEVDRMNELLKRQQEDIKTVERVTKTSKLRSDELKQETAILQAKRDSTMHELEQLNQELSGRRSKLLELESTLNQRLQELRDYQSLGLSREEVQNIISERNDLFQLVANIEEREMEKYELEKRLTVAEEDRLIEQEQFNERVADLEDELQTRVTQVEDLMKENHELKRSIESWKERLSDLQRDRELLHQDKISEQERLRQQMQRDLSDIQKQSTDEIVALKTQVIDLRKHISQLEKEIDRRNTSISSLNNEKTDIFEKVKRERADLEQRLRELELVKANEVKNLYDQLLKDRESALAEQEERLKAERQRTILKLEQKHAEEMQENAATLANAEKEISSLKEKILMLESNCDDLHAYYSKELEEKMQLVLDRERKKWTSELDAAGQSAQSEVMKVKLERERMLQQMNEEIDALRRTIGEKDNQLHRLDEELERQKENYRVSLLEKQNELLQMKTEIRETCQSELSKIRDSMQKDSQSDKNKQKATLSEYRLRLEQTQLRLNALDEAQKTATLSHVNLLRGIVEEVNANCQVLALAIGVSPKFTNADNIQVGRDNKAVVKTALATLKACSEEVRQHLLDLVRDSEALKVQLSAAQSSQGDEVAKMKALLESQHTKEMEALRDRLSKQYPQ